MAVRRTLLKSDTGVCLTQVDEVAGVKVKDTHYRLTTLRPNQPRIIAERSLAEEAFEAEVAASKRDPIAVRMSQA